jgi:drug/metabolite transporter (DMT)-like permease
LEWRTAAAIVAGALLGFSAITLYAFATRHGQLGSVSVLSSLYPAIAALLAFAVPRERISRTQ